MKTHITLVAGFAILTLHLGQAEAQRAASVYGGKFLKGNRSLISKSHVRRAAQDCMVSHLNRSRPSGAMSIGKWNRIDPSSVRLKRVELRKDTRDARGYRLGRNQTVFRAIYTALKGEGKDKKPVKLYLESEMQLGKKVPHCEFRTNSPWQGKVRTIPFGAKDPLTVTWVD